jgi:hypothetical protein
MARWRYLRAATFTYDAAPPPALYSVRQGAVMHISRLFCAVVCSTVITNACVSSGSESSESRQDAGDAVSGADAGLKPEQLSGTYLAGISTILARSAPIVFLIELAVEARDDRLEVRLRERPVSKLDRVTPIGDWSEWTTGSVDSDGHWNSDTIHVTIPADANSILAADTYAEIVLEGQLLQLRSSDDPEAELSFLCGDVTGQIIDPIPVDDLAGSTFAAARIEEVDDVTSYPELTIDCDHGLPRPLP